MPMGSQKSVNYRRWCWLHFISVISARGFPAKHTALQSMETDIVKVLKNRWNVSKRQDVVWQCDEFVSPAAVCHTLFPGRCFFILGCKKKSGTTHNWWQVVFYEICGVTVFMTAVGGGDHGWQGWPCEICVFRKMTSLSSLLGKDWIRSSEVLLPERC